MSDSLDLILAPVKVEMDRVRAMYDSALSSDNVLLQEVIRHVLGRSGKMMRPMLVMLCAKFLGQPTGATYCAAVSLELLHNATLIHDDVVDESDERHGQPSVNKQFNNKVAVLSGDFFLASALTQAARTHNPQIVDVISEIGRKLAEGELLQLYNTHDTDFSYDVYFRIIRDKTAVMFTSAARIAAISVGATPEAGKAAARFCEYVGLCFQIRDDIFDYLDTSDIGKPVGNDMLEGRLTIPVLYALNSTKDPEYMDLAMKVRALKATKDDIARLIEFTRKHGGVEYAYSVIDELRDKALALLEPFPDSSPLRALKAYLDYCIDRNK